MEMLRVIIADDEEEAIVLLRNILLDTNTVEIVDEISSPLKIESAINKHNPDALFLDIEMPGLNGLGLLENIREYNQKLAVVFVTAFEKYITDAIKLNVFSYLMKPVDRNEINILLHKLCYLKNSITTNKPQKLKLPVREGAVYINPHELLMLEAEGNYTRLKTIKGDEFMSSYNMGRLYEKLPKEFFFRINRSCILNGEYIYKINKVKSTCLVCFNGSELEMEVSKTFITEFNRKTK